MAGESKNPLANMDVTSGLLIKSRRGDNTDAAKELLIRVAERLENREALTDDVSQWLSSALRAIADGSKPNRVFNLTNRPGVHLERSEEYQRLVAEFIHESEAGRHKGYSSDGASEGSLASAHELFGIAANTANDYYINNIELILEERRLDQELRDENN